MENTEEIAIDENYEANNFKELKKNQNPGKIEPV